MKGAFWSDLRHKGPLPVPREGWIQASEGGLGFQRQGCWAPDANLVYFLSDRDGFRCIWAQRLEPGAKRPGERRSRSSISTAH